MVRVEGPGYQLDASPVIPVLPPILPEPMVYLSARQASFAAPEELPGERRVPVRLDGGGWSPRDTPRTRKGAPGGAR